jgi:hypothetical protein
MKLIIDIPEENYKKDNLIHFFRVYSEKLDEVIKKGIPLDTIRAEIEASRYGLINDGLDVALKIIDKYRK